MITDGSSLEEQAISQVVQAGLSSQLDDAEALTVDVCTNLGNAAQGRVDSVSISGKGVTLQNMRVQTIEVQTNQVTLNPLSALFGQLKLSHPVEATARVALTEADVNQAVNAPAIVSRIPPLELNVDGQPVTVQLQSPLKITLPEVGKIALDGKAALFPNESGKESRQIGFSVIIIPRTDTHPVLMEMFQCTPGEGLSIDLIIALMQKFKEILELPYIETEGIAFQLKTLDVQVGHLIVETETYISEIPSL